MGAFNRVSGWIIINIIPGVGHFDPFPFTFLTLVVLPRSDFFLSTFILISQNHETRLSERRNQLDLQINLLTEQENTKMLTLLACIAKKVGGQNRRRSTSASIGTSHAARKAR
jgi:uncharacterized membrane protein